MSEVTNETESQEPVQDERDVLKTRADQMGIKYKANIPTAKLKELVNARLTGESTPDDDDEDEDTEITKPVKATKAPKETIPQRNARLRKEASRLVRVRISCMNPAKKEWEGEIFTVANAAVGTFKKYVPFDVEDGWHVPEIILKMIQARKCQVFTTVRNDRGQKIRKGKLIKEFAVEILDDLTPAELERLARQQAMRKGNQV